MDDHQVRLPFDSPLRVHEELAELRDSSRLCQVTQPSGDTAWLVTRYGDVKALYGDGRFSRDLAAVPGSPRSVPNGDWSDNPHSMINMEGPDHQRRRRPIAEHLTAHRVAQLQIPTRKIADTLLDQMTAIGAPADFVASYAARLPLIAVGQVLGIPLGDQHSFRTDWWPVAVPDRYTPEQVETAYHQSGGYITELIAERRATPRNDLLSALVKASDAGHLDDAEVHVSVYEVVFGTLLNTKSILATGLLHLLRHREHYVALGGDQSHAYAVVDEILRLYPHPLFGLLRVATEDVELAGTTIHRGDGVLLGLGCANRDPVVYAKPDVLQPDRADPPSTTFGFGRHRCVGSALGRLYVGEGLSALARRFPGLKLACAESDVVWHNSFYELSPAAVPVTW
jgi:cytochrome P450